MPLTAFCSVHDSTKLHSCSKLPRGGSIVSIVHGPKNWQLCLRRLQHAYQT